MRSPAWLERPKAKAVLAGAVATTALALAPHPAPAFNLPRCGGTNTGGVGASFQNAAQAYWTELFGGSAVGCNNSPTIDPYQGLGSGVGRSKFGELSNGNTTGVRDPAFRYVAADEAPTDIQRSQMEKGPVDPNNPANDATTADNGRLHVIPVAIGSVALAVNYPDNCTLGSTYTVPGGNGRLQINATQLEQVFAAKITTWGGLVAGIAGTNGRTNQSCQDQPIRRIVRFDNSGTTFSLKSWLQVVQPAETPATWDSLNQADNRSWPRIGVGASIAKKVGPAASGGESLTCDTDLCSGVANGGGQVMTVLNATDGAIGYADLRTARSAGFNASGSDGTYWIPVQNSKNSTYYEPAKDASGTDPGANCASATYSTADGTPFPTSSFGNFSKVTATASPTGYPICVPTYMLVWDDYAAVYTGSGEEGKARTVKDYLDMILGPVAQEGQASRDYQALPSQLLTIAKTGAALVDFGKGGTGTGGPVSTATAGPSATATVAATATPTQNAVSNVFSIDSASVSKKAVITLTLRVPGPGQLATAATASKSGVRVGSANASAKTAGNVKVVINPSKKAKALIKKTKVGKKVKVKVAVAFTPVGGRPASQSKTLSLKGTKKHKKKGKKTT